MMLPPPVKSGGLFLMGLFLSLFLIQTAGAETKEGDLEINGSFSFVNTNIDDVDDDINTLAWTLRTGYFFTPEMQAEGGLILARSSSDGATVTFFSLDARFNYHFLTSGYVIPYVGPAFGISHFAFDDDDFDESDTGVIYGAQIGVKSFLTENVAVTTEFNVRRTAALDSNLTNLTLFAGISYFWR